MAILPSCLEMDCREHSDLSGVCICDSAENGEAAGGWIRGVHSLEGILHSEP